MGIVGLPRAAIVGHSVAHLVNTLQLVVESEPHALEDGCTVTTLTITRPDGSHRRIDAFYIADAFAQEGNRAAADSVYALVVTKYKGDAVVSRSLWKRAMMLKEAQQVDSARVLFKQIVDRYPRSDVGPLADEMLRTLRKP